MAEGSSELPLQFQLLDKVGEGNQHEVFAYPNDWVIKQTKKSGKKDTFEYLSEQSEDLKLFQRFIGEFIPATHFFRGKGEDGEIHNFVAQKHIKGRPLSSLTNEERKNPELKLQLLRFFQGCLEMWEKEGRVPDLRRVGEEKVGYRFFAPGNTDNILIDNEDILYVAYKVASTNDNLAYTYSFNLLNVKTKKVTILIPPFTTDQAYMTIHVSPDGKHFVYNLVHQSGKTADTYRAQNEFIVADSKTGKEIRRFSTDPFTSSWSTPIVSK